jgi:hypothetical protein
MVMGAGDGEGSLIYGSQEAKWRDHRKSPGKDIVPGDTFL